MLGCSCACGGVAVHHQVKFDGFAVGVEDVSVGPCDLLEEGQELLVAVPRLECRDVIQRIAATSSEPGAVRSHNTGSSHSEGRVSSDDLPESSLCTTREHAVEYSVMIGSSPSSR